MLSSLFPSPSLSLVCPLLHSAFYPLSSIPLSPNHCFSLFLFHCFHSLSSSIAHSIPPCLLTYSLLHSFPSSLVPPPPPPPLPSRHLNICLSGAGGVSCNPGLTAPLFLLSLSLSLS